MKWTFFAVLVSFGVLAPRIAVAEAAPPDLLNVVQFTRGNNFLDVRKYRQVYNEVNNAFLGEEAPCTFDVPPGTTAVDYWHANSAGARLKDPLTAAEIASRKAAAAARNALVFQTFPDWASSEVALRISTENLMTKAFGVSIPQGETRALYIAFGKIRGSYTKPGGEQTFHFFNDGEYVIERDGANTKGYFPVALCALLRTPRTF